MYHDGSSMAEHLNAFQGLINQTTPRQWGIGVAIAGIPSRHLEDTRGDLGQRMTAREEAVQEMVNFKVKLVEWRSSPEGQTFHLRS